MGDWKETHTNRDQWTAAPNRPVLVTEASSIGLKPGEWPRFITVKFPYRLRVTYERWTKQHVDGKFSGYEYVPALKPWPSEALGLIVYND